MKNQRHCLSSRKDSLKRSGTKVRSISNYDRHIRKIDQQHFNIRSASPSSSSSSYHSELEETLLNDQPVREYTISKHQKKRSQRIQNSKTKRNTQPIRSFKVPGWKDNYYSNLLDWSYNNFICVANQQTLYLYNMTTDSYEDQLDRNICTRKHYLDCGFQTLNSIHFSPIHTKIALGYSQGSLVVFDYYRETSYVDFGVHSFRISCLEWYGDTIYTGAKDRKLRAFDERTMKQSLIFPRDHSQQICGVKAYSSYIATGGNDNSVHIYDIRKTQHYLSMYHHAAAVKALDWVVPNVLVSGGGNQDRKLKFWKDGEGIVQQIDTGSQVCGVIASTNSSEILTCQGFSLNQIIIWNMKGKRNLTVHGHKNRVLYCALSPGGQYVATGAGDQSLKVWKFFDSNNKDWLCGDIR